MNQAREKKTNKKKWYRGILFLLMGVGLISAILVWIKTRRKTPKIHGDVAEKPFGFSTMGLRDEEVAERRTDSRIKARLLAEQREQILQGTRRVFSIFNVTMLVLAVSQFMLKNFWGGMGTLGALLLNVVVSLYQQYKSSRMIGALLTMARPTATAIRNGSLVNIDVDRVVIDDVLIVGVGDEILAKGVLLEAKNFLVDESHIVPDGGHITKEINDTVRPGSFCQRGWAVYRVEQYPDEIHREEISIAATSLTEINTPLQKTIRTLLYSLLIIAGIFYGIILMEALRVDVFSEELLTMYQQVVSIIFSIAPAGLIFMIVVNYAVGSGQIAKSGALLRNSLAVESLAQITSLCLMRRGSTDALGIKLEMINTSAEESISTEGRARQVLGNYAHSTQDVQFPLSVMQFVLEGEPRQVEQKARYLSLLGWEAMTFISDDLRGTYVIGDAQVLAPYLANVNMPNKNDPTEALAEESKENWYTRLTGRITRRNNDSEKQNDKKNTQANLPLNNRKEGNSTQPDREADVQLSPPKKLYRRIAAMFGDDNSTEPNDNAVDAQEESDEILSLLFAYSPQIQPLYNNDMTPQCPTDLITVCDIIFVKEIRQEIRNTVDLIIESGTEIKVLTTEEPAVALTLTTELGLITEDTKVKYITGENFDQMVDENGVEIIHENMVFTQLKTAQMVRVVNELQNQGGFVAVRGNTIADLPVMSQADLRITNRGSTPMVLSKADIIIMENSPEVLPNLILQGQKIVQSVIDMLKLNLTEIGYLLAILIIMFITGTRNFIYQSIHGGLIGIVGIVIPSFFITLWSSTIKFSRRKIKDQLGSFVLPAAGVITLFIIAMFFIIRWQGGDSSYSQQLITHFLLLVGLFLVVLTQPPHKIFSVDGVVYKDWRITKVTIVLFVLFNMVTFLPLFQKYMHVNPLKSIFHYLIIWAFAFLSTMVTVYCQRLVRKTGAGKA